MPRAARMAWAWRRQVYPTAQSAFPIEQRERSGRGETGSMPKPSVNTAAVRWGDVLKRTAGAVYADDCFGWAAELAYFWFLALFPALLCAVSLAGLLPERN